MSRHAAELHREQEHPWSCVAACVCMIKAWMSPKFAQDETAILSRWTNPKTDVRHSAEIGVLHVWDPTDPRNLERLRAALQDCWLMVTLFPGPLTYFTMRRCPPPVSKHGRLLPYDNPRIAPGLPHAVVLVEAAEIDRILYLDPYYPSNGQPFSLTEDELLEAWTGHVTIPTPPIRPLSL